jgi:U5 small nuclear ribonucleoprotein component
LHEDKNYYPDVDEIYPGVEALVMEEDTQPITEPMVPPIQTKEFDLLSKTIPDTTFEFDFLAGLMTKSELIRNIAISGTLHHGKTSFIDLLVQHTNNQKWDLNKEYRYTDCRKDEQQRGMTIKAKPMSLVLQNSKDKSYLINLLDTPGHPNFNDEISAVLRLCDGVILVVDAVEGIQFHTEKIIEAVIRENLDIILCINKIDRLPLELKIPPVDAYYKIRHIIDEFNRVVDSFRYFDTEKKEHLLSPELGNVIFSSSLYGIVFTLESYARKYNEVYESTMDHKQFSKILWGDIYFHEQTRQFSKKPSENANIRTFVQFILEPMYKVLGYSISEEKEELQDILGKLGVFLKLSEYKLDPKPLLKLICQKFYCHYSALVDVIIDKVVDSRKGSEIKLRNHYKGNQDTEIYSDIRKCSPDGALAINITKLYHKYDYISFDAFGRVLSGTVKKGDVVKVLGEKFNLQEQEDMIVKEVTNMWIFNSRYRVEINKVPANNWVLLEGVDLSISKVNFVLI